VYDRNGEQAFLTGEWRHAYALALHSARSEAEQDWEQLEQLLEDAAS
jgi:hypothetical protein